MAKNKKPKWEDALGWIVFFTGLIGLIGLSLAILEIPYGEKIALVGAVWFIPSFCIAILLVLERVNEKKEEKELRATKKKESKHGY